MPRPSQLQQAQLASQIWATWADISINRTPIMSIIKRFICFLCSKCVWGEGGLVARFFIIIILFIYIFLFF